jgi:hypothetical protein
MNPSEQIDAQIKELNDWRGERYSRIRQLIHDVDPDIKEEWKWGTAVFSHNGMVCAIGAFKEHLKINFFKGASLADPARLFNAGLEAKNTRAIDISMSDSLQEGLLKDLILEAVRLKTKR